MPRKRWSRLAVLEMGYSFFQRSGTLGEHLVTEEGDLGCLEDALRRVNEDSVQVGETELSPHSMLSLKRWNVWVVLRRPKDMKGNSNRLNGVVMVVFCISSGWTGILLYAVIKSILEKTEQLKSC
jgi:hypothetical protein